MTAWGVKWKQESLKKVLLHCCDSPESSAASASAARVVTDVDQTLGASQELETRQSCQRLLATGSVFTGFFTQLQMLLHNHVQTVEPLVKSS